MRLLRFLVDLCALLVLLALLWFVIAMSAPRAWTWTLTASPVIQTYDQVGWCMKRDRLR